MFYAQANGGDFIMFKACDTKKEAAEWIVDVLDSPDNFWVNNKGELCQSTAMTDQSATIHVSFSAAVIANAYHDPDSLSWVLHELLKAYRIED